MHLKGRTYLATAVKDSSTLSPVLAEVSMKGTLCSLPKRSPSSRFTCRSLPLQSALFPAKRKVDSIFSEARKLMKLNQSLLTGSLTY